MRQRLLAMVLCALFVQAVVSSIYLYKLYGHSMASARVLTCGVDDALMPGALSFERARAPAQVRTMVLAVSTESPLSLRGNVVAGARLRLGFSLSGVVRAVRVREGDRVHRGQLLASLSAAGLEAQVRSAQVALIKVRRDDALAEQLESGGAGTKVMRQDAQTKLQSAEASLAVAAEVLERSRLRAPVAGTVYQRLVEPGEAINAGAPVLLVDETERRVVKVGVTDRDLSRLRTGQRASLLVESTPPSEVPAWISSMAPSPDPADGQYLVQLTPSDQQRGLLRPGALVAVRFEDEKATALQVPLDALVHRKDQDWIFVVDGTAGNHAARLRTISAGRISGKSVSVLSGLQPGERIITEGSAFLKDGQPVDPSD